MTWPYVPLPNSFPVGLAFTVYGFRALWSLALKIRKKTTYILTAAPIVQEMAVVLVATLPGA